MYIDQLRHTLGPDQVLTSTTSRYAFAADAGPYLLIPEAILQPRTEDDIVAILKLSKEHRRPVVFRAGGTSLSGQSITDGWLVDIGRHWRTVEPIGNGDTVRVQPGVIGGLVNARLRHLKRKIGPDPSSIMSAMIGGMLSNNSSGMCCGVEHNAYHTLESIRFILPDASVWDTSRPDEHAKFDREQRELSTGIALLRDSLRASSSLSEKIRRKYRQKNTVGYGLNAFLDFDHPLDILSHLLIGAEGTLAFIAEAVLKTLPELPCKATALAYFQDVPSACDAIPILIQAGCAAVELMDNASLQSIRNLEGVPDELPSLLDNHPGMTAILFEFHAADEEALHNQLSSLARSYDPASNSPLSPSNERGAGGEGLTPHNASPNSPLSRSYGRGAGGEGLSASELAKTLLNTLLPIQITRDTKQQYYLWKLRKGMYPAVAAVRARGEAAILEDIAVPVEKLGPAILDLQSLFRKHHYENGIIFGHAKDGNLHFVITQSLNGSRDVEKYARFIDDMVALVVGKYDGALKAEHGTGRNMAPFVETEWGTEAVDVMRRLKKLVDPDGLLNPDVILSSKPSLHTQNLKELPIVEDVVDKCIECGACEPRCPSRDFTLSPRQRIVIRRAVARLDAAGERATADELRREYDYAGLASCATDGLCAVDCPVAINTGDLVKQLRREKTRRWDRAIAMLLVKRFGWAERLVTAALWSGTLVNRLTGHNTIGTTTQFLKRFIADIPYWHRELKAERIPKNRIQPHEAEFIYLPACMSRMMGGTATKMMEVASRVGVRMYLPSTSHGMCCGQAFSSKGYIDAAVAKQVEWIERAWQLSDQGRLTIVTDLGSCSAFLRKTPLPLPTLSHSYESSPPSHSYENSPLSRSYGRGAGGEGLPRQLITTPVAEEVVQDDGRVKVLNSPLDKLNHLRILDSIEFAHDHVLPKLTIQRKLDTIAIHSVCSNQKLGWEDKLLAVAEACAEKVIQPHHGKCCGMGGDRGFAIPNLTWSATSAVGPEMEAKQCSQGFTTARSCALGLSSGSGHPWESIFHLLDVASR